MFSISYYSCSIKYREKGKNIESLKRKTPSHPSRQTHQNKSRLLNKNIKSKEGME
jgi:hypothetical protein